MFFPFLHTAELEGSHDFRWRTAGILLGGFLLISYWQQWIVSPFQWDLAILLTFLFGYRTFNKAFRDVLARRISADQAVAVAALAAFMSESIWRPRKSSTSCWWVRRWKNTPLGAFREI